MHLSEEGIFCHQDGAASQNRRLDRDLSRREAKETGVLAPPHPQLALPAIDANELKVLFGAAVRVFIPIALLHDGLQCVFVIWTYC